MGNSRNAELSAAEDELAAAIAKWVKVAASVSDPADEMGDVEQITHPVILGYVVSACYDSVELSAENSTANVYACAQGQPAPFSAGLAQFALDRWRH